MKLTIHRGTHEVGGSCVELVAGDTRIIVDLGIPLVDEAGRDFNLRKYKGLSGPELLEEKVLPDVKGLYEWDEKSVDAVLISHAHLDHYGFLKFINPEIPVYMSLGCKDVIGAARYSGQTDYDPTGARSVPPWEDFQVGDFAVTPYLVGHSAFDAFAYLLEAEGKRVFYSGDFRAHGRKSKLFDKMVKEPPRDIDLLITEGTTIGQDTTEFKSEDDVLKELNRIFKERKRLIFLACSSQNIDRIVTVYKACKENSKQLVIPPYTAYILDQIKREGLVIPQFSWNNIRVFFVRSRFTFKLARDGKLFKFKAKKISPPEIAKKKEDLVVLDSFDVRDSFMKKGLLDHALLIYSQRERYLDKEEDFWKSNNVEIIKVHTSGHVYVEHLKIFVNALTPGKIVPIHTFFPEKYTELFGEKVTILEDGQPLEI